MNRLLSICFVLSGMCVALSCCDKELPSSPPENVPPTFTISDSNWSDTLVLQESTCWGRTRLSLSIELSSSSSVSPNLIHAFDEVSCDLSPAEQFAIEKIRERSKVLMDFYKEIIHNSQLSTHLTNVYIRESPKVYADKTLFGVEPGEDLSPFFEIFGPEFKCTGPDYKVVDGRLIWTFYMTDYFSEGAMMPKEFTILAYLLFEDQEDKDVNIRFIFPVTIEHYWSWLLELYDNQEAEKSFTETELILDINLKDIPFILYNKS